MAHAFIIQSASGQTNGGSVDLNLPASPLVGNTLYLIATGFSGGITPPPGFTQLAANTNDQNFNATWLYSRSVQPGDSSGPYTCTSATDVRMFVLVEITGAATVIANHGSASSNGNTITMNGAGVTAYPNTGAYVRLLAWEWDNRGPALSQINYSAVRLLSPNSFMDNTYGYHASIVTYGAATDSGPLSITLSGPVNYPVWMDVVFQVAGPALYGSPGLQYFAAYQADGTDIQIPFVTSRSSGATAGNLLLAMTASAGPVGAPSGWSVVGSAGSSARLAVYSKVATGGETSVTFKNNYNDGSKTNNRFGAFEISKAPLQPVSGDGLEYVQSNPWAGNLQATINYPARPPRIDQTSLRLMFGVWDTRNNYPSFVQGVDDVSNFSILLLGGTSPGVSFFPAVVDWGLAGLSRSVSMAANAPNNSAILWIDIASSLGGTTGAAQVMWLL